MVFPLCGASGLNPGPPTCKYTFQFQTLGKANQINESIEGLRLWCCWGSAVLGLQGPFILGSDLESPDPPLKMHGGEQRPVMTGIKPMVATCKTCALAPILSPWALGGIFLDAFKTQSYENIIPTISK